ncbi:MAG: hypothetical protein V3V45_06680, partial [Candidatus Brocadiales bacterium]
HSRQIGEAGFARDVYYGWRKLIAPTLCEKPFAFLWDRFLEYGVGYGVRPYYFMIIWFLLCWFAGFVIFKFPLFIEPASIDSPCRIPSHVEAIWLSLVNLLPGIPGEYPKVTNQWQLTIWGAYIATVLRLFGWIVVSVSSLTASGLFRKYLP